MKVIYFDVIAKLPLGNARQVASMDELLSQADVVSLHVPELPSTMNMMRAAEFAKMKRGGIFINAARGTCVDIDALAAAIESKHLSGAAIDVFPVEPKGNDEEFLSALRPFDNVILTPHIGGSTQEAQANIGIEVGEKFVRYSDAGSTVTAVNFPEVSIPQQPGTHRLLHIHRNVPGVLSAVNSLFARNNINIAAQSMLTKGDIGYMIMDVEASASDAAIDALQTVEGTLRTRVLY